MVLVSMLGSAARTASLASWQRQRFAGDDCECCRPGRGAYAASDISSRVSGVVMHCTVRFLSNSSAVRGLGAFDRNSLMPVLSEQRRDSCRFARVALGRHHDRLMALEPRRSEIQCNVRPKQAIRKSEPDFRRYDFEFRGSCLRFLRARADHLQSERPQYGLDVLRLSKRRVLGRVRVDAAARKRSEISHA